MTESTGSGTRDAISTANKEFMAAFDAGDAAGLAALYTEEGWLMPPNADLMVGRPAIQAFWQAVMDMGIKSAVIKTDEVEGHGDTAIEVSRYVLKGEGGQVADKGKFIVIWKQLDGEWLLHRDIFNSSMPPPA